MAAFLCPKCCAESRVIKTSQRADGVVRRRRECLYCKRRFSTVEMALDCDKTPRISIGP